MNAYTTTGMFLGYSLYLFNSFWVTFRIPNYEMSMQKHEKRRDVFRPLLFMTLSREFVSSVSHVLYAFIKYNSLD